MATAARLVMLDGDQKGREFLLEAGETTIGRLAGNGIVVDEPSVSRQHAVLQAAQDGFTIRDLGSYNGTYVMGRRVDTAVLKSGDTFRVGNVKFQLFLDLAVPVVAERSAPTSPGGKLVQQRTAATAPAPDAAAVGMPGAEPMAPDPQVVGQPNRVRRLVAAAAVAFLCAGVAAVVYIGRETPPLTEGLAMKVGEVRLVESGTISKNRQLDFDSVTVVGAENGTPSDAVEATPWASDIVKIVAKREVPGGIDVRLLCGEKTVEVLTVVVRGHLEMPSERYRGNLNDDEKANLAERLVEDGLSLQASEPYYALQKYHEAVAVTAGSAYPFAVGNRARDLAAEVEKRLTLAYENHRRGVRNAVMMRDYLLAAREMRAIMQLIPDPHDVRYQHADIFLNRLKRGGFLQ